MAESNIYKSSLSKSMDLCSRREYCTEEIRVKLESWGVAEKDREKILTALKKDNFINENRYAEAFVRDKFKYNKWGKVKISALLKMKKIPSDTIKESLELIDQDNYRKTLRDILASHRKSVKSKNNFELYGKLMRYGLSKGFESSLLHDILDELL